MAQLTLENEVKVALRVSGTAFDDGEVVPLIEAAKKDLSSAGIATTDTPDPLIRRAVVSYCKWQFGYDNPEAERFERIYESIKGKLSMLTAYKPQTAEESGVEDG